MDTKIVTSVKEVDRSSWNTVLKGPYFSHEWFSFIESQCRSVYSPFYILFYKKEQLSAILPTFMPKTGDNSYDRQFWGRLLKFSSFMGSHKKALLCFSPDNYSGGFFSGNEIGTSDLEMMLAELDNFARVRDISEIVFLRILQESEDAIETLKRHGYEEVFLSASGILTNRFPSFDDYLAALGSNMRSVVKREIKKFKRSGSVVEILPEPLSEIDILCNLINNIQDAHNVDENPYTKEKLCAMFENMGDYLTCYVVRHEGDIIATVSLIEKDSILAPYALGVHYERCRETGAYFNLFYYNTIAEMIRRGSRAVNFEPMAYVTKKRRGCELVEQYMLVKRRKRKLPFAVWKHVLTYWYRKKFYNYGGTSANGQARGKKGCRQPATA